MGGVPQLIPYEEFLELRKEVKKVNCALNLALKILGGLVGLTDDEVKQELNKELKEICDTSVSQLLPNKVKTLNNVNDYRECEADSLKVGNVNRTESDIVPVKCTPTNDKLSTGTKRKICLKPPERLIPVKKPLITPVNISTLLPSCSTDQLNTGATASCSLSEIDRECMETNNLLNRLLNNKVSIDIETVEVENTDIVTVPDSKSVDIVALPVETVKKTYPLSTSVLPQKVRKKSRKQKLVVADDYDLQWEMNKIDVKVPQNTQNIQPEVIDLEEDSVSSIKTNIVGNFRKKIQNKIQAASGLLMSNSAVGSSISTSPPRLIHQNKENNTVRVTRNI